MIKLYWFKHWSIDQPKAFSTPSSHISTIYPSKFCSLAESLLSCRHFPFFAGKVTILSRESSCYNLLSSFIVCHETISQYRFCCSCSEFLLLSRTSSSGLRNHPLLSLIYCRSTEFQFSMHFSLPKIESLPLLFPPQDFHFYVSSAISPHSTS